ncbi:acetyl/propionyl/methylcrotonyl-CoA carboxylase subunit alpha [Celerinatantimonas diazotrophica]|uniref:Biotin carboxylase n=1 Tax=Celerinatantimonas diazotrophica TaxID=412034 RepID=A0A4R1J807_9GAMM|nr:biotin carboxylase N-terminal domain-containing protein [Celerinatantimonas diazotrophica]TCK46622.1 acetyl-CoA/propionyl-CoA carboxylase biotin carboxyl carrier protein [Celerinatantimonas diazotrophica]CAG9296672.1 Carbamoyl-phosphate synthase large chain [Celerinatantimonas diazotrophica]
MSFHFSSNHQPKVLIANRGEIAVRIIQACHDVGALAVAVYADTDSQAMHVEMADEAYALEGRTAQDSYLNIEKLLSIAKRCQATMVHPGYGFLSERSEFAQAVIAAGLTWIGPAPETIDMLGNKVSARQLAQKVGAPLAKGTDKPVANAQEVIAFARQYGLPIAIKAAFGGGGRGLKVARKMEDVAELYHSAVREAQAAFGRGECFVEQFLESPRHIEVQVLCDQFGQIAVLGTRDCSLQRRNQKLVEEAPAPYLTAEQRQTLHASARDICQAAHYVGAATVEFLLSRDGTIAFLEVNTRLQVEHPVTEMITGIDIVVEQLRIASGLKLDCALDVGVQGHAFEFRINAEDPGKGFLPTPGTITQFKIPTGPGVRLDTGVCSGSLVPGEFDSLMAKLIIYGQDREQALQRAGRALSEFVIEGVSSVLDFHRAVVECEDFVEDFAVHTRWIETQKKLKFTSSPRPQSDARAMHRFMIEIDGKRCQIGLPAELLAGFNRDAVQLEQLDPLQGEMNSGRVNAPITGSLYQWRVADGETVKKGQTIAIMEAMKMELQVFAPCDGKLVQQIGEGEAVSAEQIIGQVMTSC